MIHLEKYYSIITSKSISKMDVDHLRGQGKDSKSAKVLDQRQMRCSILIESRSGYLSIQ
jgi:hypothetical protein